MGLYNVIKDFKVQCPICGEWVTQFQTKDKQDMGESEVTDVSNFYSGCRGCGSWIEFNRRKPDFAGMTPNEYAKQYFEVTVENGTYPKGMF